MVNLLRIPYRYVWFQLMSDLRTEHFHAIIPRGTRVERHCSSTPYIIINAKKCVPHILMYVISYSRLLTFGPTLLGCTRLGTGTCGTLAPSPPAARPWTWSCSGAVCVSDGIPVPIPCPNRRRCSDLWTEKNKIQNYINVRKKKRTNVFFRLLQGI